MIENNDGYQVECDIPIMPVPSRERLLAMREAGHRIGDEIAERIEPLFVLSGEDLCFLHK